MYWNSDKSAENTVDKQLNSNIRCIEIKDNACTGYVINSWIVTLDVLKFHPFYYTFY